MDQYDIVFIGYPNWALDVPQAIRSFLSSYDLSGKTVVPFCTHDGYGAGRTYNSVKEEATGANVLEGIAIEATDVPSAESQVQDWLERIGIEREEPQGASVRITAGGHTFTGEWLDTPLADEIRGMFPLTATLGRYGGREYYGSMPRRLIPKRGSFVSKTVTSLIVLPITRLPSFMPKQMTLTWGN